MARINELTAILEASITSAMLIAIGLEGAVDDRKATLAEFAKFLSEEMKDIAETITTKSINANNNTITNIANAEIKAAAAIAMNKLAVLTGNRPVVTNNISGFLEAAAALGTAFNKDFGEASDDVASGTHNHPSPMTFIGWEGANLDLYQVNAQGVSINGQPSFDIAVAIPDNVVILGCTLRVDSILSQAGSGAYISGATQTLGAIAAALNTKVYTHFDSNSATPITSAITNIRVTANVGNFGDSTGKVTAVVFYRFLSPINNYGA